MKRGQGTVEAGKGDREQLQHDERFHYRLPRRRSSVLRGNLELLSSMKRKVEKALGSQCQAHFFRNFSWKLRNFPKYLTFQANQYFTNETVCYKRQLVDSIQRSIFQISETDGV